MGISKEQLLDSVSQIKAYVDNKAADISPDFLDEGGFGNIRYINGKLQVNTNGQWVDAIADQANQYIIKMSPNAMKSFIVAYDSINLSYKLRFEEPDDTIVDGQIICMLDGVKIMRKLGSAPTDENDGVHVVTISRRHFGEHKTEWLFDEENKAVTGEEWFYKAFPYSTVGFYNYASLNEGSAVCKDYELYAFRINQAESNPAYMISYPEDCDNTNYASAHMDFTAGVFDYGDWRDAFFMQVKPCMLKYDGKVDYYLDPNDYSRKIDGSGSDVANINYDGNCMIEFPLTYMKIVPNDTNENVCTVYISNKKLDNGFTDYSFRDENGNQIPYCYMSAFNGYVSNGKLRSISGVSPTVSTSFNDFVSYSHGNKESTNEYSLATYEDRNLLSMLCLLIGKSANSQAVFGNGVQGQSGASARVNTGTLNGRGLFYGSNLNNVNVKIFGIEGVWGNSWQHHIGLVKNLTKIKVKRTYSSIDGSTVSDYNTTGDGYLPSAYAAVTESGKYIQKMYLSENGFIAGSVGGSSSTYYCDSVWTNNTNITISSFGGACDTTSFGVGLFCASFYMLPTVTANNIGSRLSCKPLAEVN